MMESSALRCLLRVGRNKIQYANARSHCSLRISESCVVAYRSAQMIRKSVNLAGTSRGLPHCTVIGTLLRTSSLLAGTTTCDTATCLTNMIHSGHLSGTVKMVNLWSLLSQDVFISTLAVWGVGNVSLLIVHIGD